MLIVHTVYTLARLVRQVHTSQQFYSIRDRLLQKEASSMSCDLIKCSWMTPNCTLDMTANLLADIMSSVNHFIRHVHQPNKYSLSSIIMKRHEWIYRSLQWYCQRSQNIGGCLSGSQLIRIFYCTNHKLLMVQLWGLLVMMKLHTKYKTIYLILQRSWIKNLRT